MSREDFIAVAARMFAIYLAIVALRTAIGLVAMPGAFEEVGLALLSWSAAVVAPLLVAALLWVFPLTIARKLLPVMREAKPPLTTDGQALAIGLTLIGVYLLANAVADAAYWFTHFLALREYAVRMHLEIEWGPDKVGAIVTTGVELALGVGLTLGGRGLASVLRRLRYAGSRLGAPEGSDWNTPPAKTSDAGEP